MKGYFEAPRSVFFLSVENVNQKYSLCLRVNETLQGLIQNQTLGWAFYENS